MIFPKYPKSKNTKNVSKSDKIAYNMSQIDDFVRFLYFGNEFVTYDLMKNFQKSQIILH